MRVDTENLNQSGLGLTAKVLKKQSHGPRSPYSVGISTSFQQLIGMVEGNLIFVEDLQNIFQYCYDDPGLKPGISHIASLMRPHY